MADYWVYENWVHDRARIHHSSCPHCNNGDGSHSTTSTAHGQWLPFNSYREAAASEAMRRADSGECGVCHPS